jgi:hypothetical protein
VVSLVTVVLLASVRQRPLSTVKSVPKACEAVFGVIFGFSLLTVEGIGVVPGAAAMSASAVMFESSLSRLGCTRLRASTRRL